MKRILFALLAITTGAYISAEMNVEYNNAVNNCKRSCRKADTRCHSECERSVAANFGYGVIDLVPAAVQTGTVGIIPTNSQAVEDYNIPKNFARGAKRLFVDAGRVVTLGHVARGDEHETNF